MSKVLLVLRILFGLIFLGAGAAKLFGAPMMVTEFGEIGLGQWFRYATGVIEILGALLLIRPNTVTLGAGILTCVAIGAFIAQLRVLHIDVIHTIVFAVLLAWIAYSYRGGALKRT